MMTVLLRAGMRIGELLNLLVREVNLKERRIEISEAEKTRVGRVVYLSEDARVALQAWFKERDPKQSSLSSMRRVATACAMQSARVVYLGSI